MKRSSLLKLRQPVWIRVEEDAQLECEIVPAAAVETASLIMAPGNRDIAERICKTAFLDFRGYENGDGHAVENTLEARMELYGWPPCRAAINQALQRLNAEAAEAGKDVASDLLATASR